MFNGAQGVSVNGDAHNVVHRDQYNRTTTVTNRIFRVERPGRTVVKKERKRHGSDSKYGRYREIIHGDINRFEQLFSAVRWDWEWKDGKVIRTCHSCRTTIHKAQVYGDNKVYTVISYHGRDAKKIWKEDFMKYSQADDPAVLLQLFAINRSNVPTLLFHDEWLPLGHLQSKMEGTFWEGYYLNVYTDAWCDEIHTIRHHKLWMNSRTGRVSSGPDGPTTSFHNTSVSYNCEDMPSAMEMVTADTCLGFFNRTGAGNLNLDVDVLQYASKKYSDMCTKNLLCIDSPDVYAYESRLRDIHRGLWYYPCYRNEVQDFIGKLRLDTVYSGVHLDKIAVLKGSPAYTWSTCSFALWPCAMSYGQTLLDNGLTRFWFPIGVESKKSISIHFDMDVLQMAWLSQAHRLDLPTSGPETCFIPNLEFFLQLKPRPKQCSVLDLETLPIVYLFLRPPPLCIRITDIDSWLSQISFWSFDENGTSEIPEMECERLGLPIIAWNNAIVHLRTWPKYVYDGLHAWQVARGFDPTTADWARSLGQPILEPAITRIEEVVEAEEPPPTEEDPSPTSDPLPSQDSASDKTVAEKEEEETTSSLTSLWRSWSWTATPQSDFSAFAV